MVLACAVMAVGALAVTRDGRVAGGILGGGLLVGMAMWAVAAVAGMLGGGAENGGNPAISRSWLLVKFFTRHVILALVAYVMMVRLHLDPVGMVVGVTSVVIAAVVEAMRPR
jgi:hypothetical protein